MEIRPCQIPKQNNHHCNDDLEDAARQIHPRGILDDKGLAQQIKARDILLEHRQRTDHNAEHHIAEKRAPMNVLDLVHLHAADLIVRLILFEVHKLRLFVRKRIFNLICHSGDRPF